MKFDPTDLMDRLHAHRASLNAVIAETQAEITAAAQKPVEFTVSARGTELEVIADIEERQSKGIAKYGTTVADNPLDLRAWLQHAYEECLDQAVYLKRAIRELDQIASDASRTAVKIGESAELEALWARLRAEGGIEIPAPAAPDNLPPYPEVPAPILGRTKGWVID